MGMAHVFVTRVRELLTGLTRVTFSGCGGDPGVWEQAAKRRWRDVSEEFAAPAGPGDDVEGRRGDPHVRREQPVHSVRRT